MALTPAHIAIIKDSIVRNESYDCHFVLSRFRDTIQAGGPNISHSWPEDNLWCLCGVSVGILDFLTALISLIHPVVPSILSPSPANLDGANFTSLFRSLVLLSLALPRRGIRLRVYT
jgi:hypothetical protein